MIPLSYGGKMYVVVVYDVSIERVNEIRKFLRRYLIWVQNSVFEGEVTKSEYERIRSKLFEMVREKDSIIIYLFRTRDEVKKEVIGLEKGFTDVLI